MTIGLIIPFALSLVGCSPAKNMGIPTLAVNPEAIKSDPQGKITVLAATALTEPFSELGELFEAQNPNTVVEFSFGGSQQLAGQITHQAPADVFASANEKYMNEVIEMGRVEQGTQKVFTKNQLVVIFPKNNPANLQRLVDLSRTDLKLVMAAKEVPVGQYTIDFLTKASTDPLLGEDFPEKVIQNVVSYEDTVKAVLAKVSLGEADAGIVYSSDVTGDAKNQVGVIEIPDEMNVVASFPIAIIKDSSQPILAQKFMDLVLSQDGQDILSKFGFIPLSE
jgi:molybdate transport system substrate-binding protein